MALAGRVLGLPVTVVVPETATERAKTLLRRGRVIVHGASWQRPIRSPARWSDRAMPSFIPSTIRCWEGHATLIDELQTAGFTPMPSFSVGGGGLLCGVVAGRSATDSPVPVIAVETEGAASFHAALQAGHPVEPERITSVATSLGARRVCDQAVRWAALHPIRSVVISDRSAFWLASSSWLITACSSSRLVAPAWPCPTKTRRCSPSSLAHLGGGLRWRNRQHRSIRDWASKLASPNSVSRGLRRRYSRLGWDGCRRWSGAALGAQPVRRRCSGRCAGGVADGAGSSGEQAAIKLRNRSSALR